MRLLIILHFIPLFVQAQNLVPNGSFEDYDLLRNNRNGEMYNVEVYNKHSFFMFEDWQCFCSADLVSPKGPAIISKPNIRGNPLPKSGEAYIYISLYCSEENYCGEYVYVKLNASLKKDTSYIFEAYLYPRRGIKKAVDAFGAVFLDPEGFSRLPHEEIREHWWESGQNGCGTYLKGLRPQVSNPEGKLMYAGTDQWYHLKDTLTAKGGEIYMLLGNFEYNKNVKNISKLEVSSSYFIDDVSLYPMHGTKEDHLERKRQQPACCSKYY